MTIDLTVRSPDLGIAAIIAGSTDAAERHRVATDPGVVAIATRAAELTTEQRQRISEAYAKNFNTYRLAWSRLHRRVRQSGGPNQYTTRAVDERIGDLFACKGGGPCAPYHTCGTTFFTGAINDTIYAHLARTYLTDDEMRIFNGPFLDVAGKVDTPVLVRFDGEEINARWNNAFPAGNDPTNLDHEWNPRLGAPVANLLGHPWYLESGSPGGDFTVYLNLPGGGHIVVSPSEAGDRLMRWYIGVHDDCGEPLSIDHELLISEPPEVVAGRARRITVEYLISQFSGDAP